MHRWQSLSAATCRQSYSHDFARVAQGIEASIRSFHISAAKAADNSPSPSSSQPRQIPPTRRAAAAKAGQEIARLPSKLRIIRTSSSSDPQSGFVPSTGRTQISPNAPLLRGGPLARGALRGGIRGGRGGRGGRGSRGGRGGRGGAARGRRRNLGSSSEGAEDFNLPGSVAPAEADAFSILEAHEEHWRTETESTDYTELMEIVESAHARNAEAVNLLKEADKAKDAAKKSQAEGMLDAVSQDVKRGLDKLVEAQNSVFPNHTPLDLKDGSKPQGMVGGVPVGKDGFGAIVEDALRIISDRQGHKYEEPRNLAKRLIAGELIKFTDPYEKLVVTRMANEMGYREHGPDGVGFEPLAPAARGDLVKSIVSGRYDAPTAGVQGDAMKNIARIMGGNATYTPGAKATVLETLQSMLPRERPQTPRAQPRQN